MEVTAVLNAIAYYAIDLTTALKSFIEQAPDSQGTQLTK
jgi:hypothetical protein